MKRIAFKDNYALGYFPHGNGWQWKRVYFGESLEVLRLLAQHGWSKR